MVASALSYTAVVDSLKQESSELKKKFINTNGPMDFTSEHPLLFPCCIRCEAVAALNTLLQCWVPNISLKPVAYEVPMQTSGVDCGIHVMHHIRTIVKV
ncbi:hypothetical protein GBAR_LOCUS27838 [Geodia barretti]|nr:hypothetical protein GBAR_LOCUS20940 [Geodia barretti]CAI8050766.1 hypothetical protein GBAR_LOCUS27838 [Geodia barretti]